ncbi:MAPEG family protein [Alteromonas macleodii]|uniref:MAPEG family protein n=1 Tax=Alteromonas macleodii TaxID=28108 RepID=UPI0015D42660|nr:MAPEG family protein [Alteromonas macleodii]
MNLTILAISGYITWTLLLLLALEAFRTYLVISSGRKSNSFNTSGSDTTEFGHRLTRAHANCYEFFPIFGGTLIVAVITNTTDITNSLSLLCLFARIAQSFTHLLSGSNIATQIRFLFFTIQVGVCSWWMYQIVSTSF